MRVMRSPRSVEIAITNRCNLRCTYCSHFTGPGDVAQDLPTEEWLLFFKELKDCSVMDLTLQGAEAFIREDMKEIIQGIVQNKMRFSILTNGTLITEEMAAFLASTRRCNNIQVSIDGSSPETHDSFRTKGSFERALEGIHLLRKHSVPTSVRVTIHRKNVHDLERVSKMLLEDMGLPGFSTNAASFQGLCRQYEKEVILTAKEHAWAMKTLLKLNKKYNGRISATAGPLANAQEWMKMEKARQEGVKNIPGRGHLTSCHGPMQTLGVRADGVMVPCILMSHIELGRINQDKLLEVWQNHPELRRLRDRDDIPLQEFEFCKGCPYINYCAGNCPALAFTITGEENYPSPDACLRRFLEEGGNLPE